MLSGAAVAAGSEYHTASAVSPQRFTVSCCPRVNEGLSLDDQCRSCRVDQLEYTAGRREGRRRTPSPGPIVIRYHCHSSHVTDLMANGRG